MSLTVSTIKFNVGGRMFEVNRSLLEHFPETLLAKLSQEQDGNGNGDGDDSNDSSSSNEKKAPSDDNDAILFIDRDSDRFACILNYMRDGKIDLPVNISKQSLLTDFAYYGFDSIDPDSIGTYLSMPETFSVLKHCREKFTTMKDNISSRKRMLETETKNNIKQIQDEASRKVKELMAKSESTLRQLEEEGHYNYIAYECFYRYSKNFNKEEEIVLPGVFKIDSTDLASKQVESKLQECFASYGLEVISIEPVEVEEFDNKVVVNFDVTNIATNIRPGKRCRE